MAAAQENTVQSTGSVSGAAIYTVHSIPPGPEQVPQGAHSHDGDKTETPYQVSRSRRPSQSPSPSARSFPFPSRDFQPTLLIRKLRPKVSQLGHYLARPISQGHISGYYLAHETGPSHPQLLSFGLGRGQGPGARGLRVVLEGRRGQTHPPACPCCCSPGPASACSAYVSWELDFHCMLRK